jgi:AcrR family transcriptional regulator
MEAVATLANVPKSTLYKRYPDKGQLLEAVLRKKVQEWSAISTARDSDLTNDLRQRLTRYAASLMTWALDPDVQTFSRLAAVAYGFSGRRAGGRRFFAYEQMLNLIAEDIVRFGPSQRIVSRDPKRVAAALMAFVAGWIESLDPGQEVSPATINREAEYMVSIMIDGNACW